jgi:hypothetical protein
MGFSMQDDKIGETHILADSDRLDRLELVFLTDDEGRASRAD